MISAMVCCRMRYRLPYALSGCLMALQARTPRLIHPETAILPLNRHHRETSRRGRCLLHQENPFKGNSCYHSPH